MAEDICPADAWAGQTPPTPRQSAGCGPRNQSQLTAPNGTFVSDHHGAPAQPATRCRRQAPTLHQGPSPPLDPIPTILWPTSLGAFYEALTDVFGFERHDDQWKVMGLAAHGEPTFDLVMGDFVVA